MENTPEKSFSQWLRFILSFMPGLLVLCFLGYASTWQMELLVFIPMGLWHFFMEWGAPNILSIILACFFYAAFLISAVVATFSANIFKKLILMGVMIVVFLCNVSGCQSLGKEFSKVTQSNQRAARISLS